MVDPNEDFSAGHSYIATESIIKLLLIIFIILAVLEFFYIVYLKIQQYKNLENDINENLKDENDKHK